MECEINPKKQKNIVLMGILIGISLLIIVLTFWFFFRPWPLTFLKLNEEINIDKDISSQYISTIKPEGDKKILEAVNNASKFDNDSEKLGSILYWQLYGWVNPRWGVSSTTCYDPACRYFFFNNDKTKMRADIMYPPRFGTIYFPNDPAWIAFHKTGACQEISVLFAETANRAGYQTQTVNWLSHQWPEVNINGEWWYYDPVCAYEKYQLNQTNSSMWFNKTKFFRTNCYSEAIVVFDSKIWYDFTPTFRYYF